MAEEFGGTYTPPDWSDFTWDDFVGPTAKETFLKYGILPEGLNYDEAKEKLKSNIEKLKPFWPLLLIPVAKWAFDRKDKEDSLMESIDSIALVNFLTGYKDYIMALGWYLASRVSTPIENLSLTLVGAESIPTLDLNLPKGVMLGSWLAVGDYAIEFIRNTKSDVADLMEEGHTTKTTGPLDILIGLILSAGGYSESPL